MKHLSLAIAILISIVSLPSQPLWNPLAVDVTRSLSKDLFESNAVPYIQPMESAWSPPMSEWQNIAAAPQTFGDCIGRSLAALSALADILMGPAG